MLNASIVVKTETGDSLRDMLKTLFEKTIGQCQMIDFPKTNIFILVHYHQSST